MNPVVRRVAVAVLALLPLAGLAVAAAVLAPRSGPTLATHWSGLQRPDGFAPTLTTLVVCAVVGAAGAATALLAVVRRRPWSRGVASTAAMAGGTTASAWVICAWATADAPRPADAVLGGRLLLIAVPIVIGVLLGRLLPPVHRELHAPSLPSAGTALGDDERIVYTAVITSPVLTVSAVVACTVAVVAGAALAVGSPAGIAPAVVLAFAALAVLAVVPARLTVDARGIRLTSVLLRLPLIRVRLDDIATVTAEHIEPLQWGGWGYRFSGAGRAYVARRGDGIVIRRRGGAALAITVDRASVPAGVANALVARRESGSTARGR